MTKLPSASGRGKILKTAGVFAIAVAAAFLVSLVFIAALGVNPFVAYGKMFMGAFGKKSGIFEILAKATPLTIMGLGVSVAACPIWAATVSSMWVLCALCAWAFTCPIPSARR